MQTVWRDTFLFHAETVEHKQRVEEAREIITAALAAHKKTHIAFSGGKDSLAMMHLALSIEPKTLVVHWDYGRYYIPESYRDEIRKILFALAKNFRVYTSPEYDRLGRNAIGVLGREYIEKVLPKLYDEGITGSFVGLRKQESYKRRKRIESDESLTKIKEYFPLADWTWLDVWAYIVKHDLPYLSHYDRYAPVVGYDKARFTTLFDPEFDAYGLANLDGVLSWRHRNL